MPPYLSTCNRCPRDGLQGVPSMCLVRRLPFLPYFLVRGLVNFLTICARSTATSHTTNSAKAFAKAWDRLKHHPEIRMNTPSHVILRPVLSHLLSFAAITAEAFPLSGSVPWRAAMANTASLLSGPTSWGSSPWPCGVGLSILRSCISRPRVPPGLLNSFIMSNSHLTCSNRKLHFDRPR